jgi:sugar transferase (PEP-CTERM/EpsH1 system associated)
LTKEDRLSGAASDPSPPLIAHVLYRFDVGGLENGVVNLINHMAPNAYRHMVVALTEVTDFRQRLQRPDVECVALHKKPGHGARVYPSLWRLLKARRPAIVHTRNLAALEMQAAAWAAGVPARIHGEHGRDIDDLDGSSRRHQRLRQLYSPFVHRYVALSRDLETYLSGSVGIAPRRIAQIYNGVNAEKFAPAQEPGLRSIAGGPFQGPGLWLAGTVGRMAAVKNQTLLARAFLIAREADPEFAAVARLVMIGDGPLRAQAQTLLDNGGAHDAAWLPGERSDVADVMRSLDCFVLPSLAEGISNTILEAMACGLPVIATAVGGNVELVDAGRNGLLGPNDDPLAMAQSLLHLWRNAEVGKRMGCAGRADVEQRFSMQAMVSAYQHLYDQQISAAGISLRDH